MKCAMVLAVLVMMCVGCAVEKATIEEINGTKATALEPSPTSTIEASNFNTMVVEVVDYAKNKLQEGGKILTVLLSDGYANMTTELLENESVITFVDFLEYASFIPKREQ